MKKTKIERIVYEDTWCPQFPWPVEWDTFKQDIEYRIKHSIEQGYSNPMVRYKGYDEYAELEIYLTKLEDEDAFNKRKAVAEEKLAKGRAVKIEKLKKEEKKLGLKIE